VGSTAPPQRERLPSVDILRGAVMAVMALDHVRDYFYHTQLNWMDPAQTRADLFLTRFAAQFCAPAFFLLAGIGAALSQAGGKPTATVAGFLFKRGLVLIALDLTVVRLAWDFNFRYDGGPWFIVLSALGAAMMAVAGLMFLPRWCAAVVAVGLISSGNGLDGLIAGDDGPLHPLWVALRLGGSAELFGWPFYVTYTLLPWVGVMVLGYVLGPLLRLEPERRRRALWLVGALFFLAFAAGRTFGLYGDPRPWQPDPDHPLTVLSFFRTKKYPASVQHVCLFVGLLLMGLSRLDRGKGEGRVSRWFIRLGRAPLFYYVLHVYVIHALAVILGLSQGFPLADLLVLYTRLPEGYGLGLGGLYAVWVVVLAVCYPVCAWFDGVKRRSKAAWLTYL
jgi:uncharacterized membrane protein